MANETIISMTKDDLTKLVYNIAEKVAEKYATNDIVSKTSNGLMSFEDKIILDKIAEFINNLQDGEKVLYGTNNIDFTQILYVDKLWIEDEFMEHIEIPSEITKIRGGSFMGSKSIKSVIIPESVTSIGDMAFYFCTELTTVTFKGTPDSIGDSAFSGCTNLKTINVPWASGAVPGAPWGATSATIVYNYKG